MTVMAFPRSKKCNDRALRLVREEVKASLVASKAEKKLGSRALRALGRAVEYFVALCWAGMLLVLLSITFAVCGAGLALGFEIGKAIYRWIVG